jgi:hypothetical protein
MAGLAYYSPSRLSTACFLGLAATTNEAAGFCSENLSEITVPLLLPGFFFSMWPNYLIFWKKEYLDYDL